MRNGFRYAIEHKAHTHAGTKQHGKPTQQRIVRSRFAATDTQAAERRHRHQQAEHQQQIAGQHHEAVEMLGYADAQTIEQGRGPGWPQQRADNDEQGNDRRRKKHRRLDLHASKAARGLAVAAAVDLFGPVL